MDKIFDLPGTKKFLAAFDRKGLSSVEQDQAEHFAQFTFGIAEQTGVYRALDLQTNDEISYFNDRFATRLFLATYAQSIGEDAIASAVGASDTAVSSKIIDTYEAKRNVAAAFLPTDSPQQKSFKRTLDRAAQTAAAIITQNLTDKNQQQAFAHDMKNIFTRGIEFSSERYYEPSQQAQEQMPARLTGLKNEVAENRMPPSPK